MKQILPIIVCCFLWFSFPVLAAPQISAPDASGNRNITAASYTATIGADGCLTEVKAGSTEFIDSSTSVSRGMYFFTNNAVVKMTDVEQLANSSIVAKSAAFGIRYDFSDTQITCTLTNNSAAPVPFYGVIPATVHYVEDQTGSIVQLPTREAFSTAAWMVGSDKLTMVGTDQIWGPWINGTEAAQVNLAPGSTKVLTITPGAVTADELTKEKTAKAPAPAVPIIPADIKAVTAVQYTQSGTPELMDIYTLKAAPSSPQPAIVWIHGGGWIEGDRKGMEGAMYLLARLGYVACTIDYRLSSVAKFPAQIQDCKCAIRYLRANASLYNIDPKRIGIWGDSAGGHLVALMGVTSNQKIWDDSGGWSDRSSAVQAVCDWFGPTDLSTLLTDPTVLPFTHNVVAALVGGSGQQALDTAKAASPMTYVAAGDPPFLIQHGDKDPVVPLVQSQEFYAKLQAAGDDATLTVIPGAGHTGPLFNTPQNWAIITSFFGRVLKP